jgi:targeting protein for Xklp2
MDRKVEEVKPPAPLKAHAVPHFGLPFLPKLQDKTQVEVCPFSFEERERERRVLKEKRLEELRHEEVAPLTALKLFRFLLAYHLPYILSIWVDLMNDATNGITDAVVCH